MVRDMTKQGRCGVEEKKLRKDHKVSDFGSLLSDWLWEIDQTGHLIYSNGVLEQQLDLNTEGWLATSIEDVISAINTFDRHQNQLQLEQLANFLGSQLPVRDLEFYFTDQFGEEKRLLIGAEPVLSMGEFIGHIGVGRIEKNQLPTAENTEQLLTLMKAVENAPIGVLITDSNGLIKYANPGFVGITGYSLEDAKGKTPRILSSGQNSQAFYKKFWATIKDGKSWQGTVRNRRKDGSFFWCRETVSPVTRRDGTISNFIAMQQDVTVEVEAQEKLKASEARFKGFADSASDWYWEMDADLKFSYVSEAACESAGMTRDEMLGMERSELVTVQSQSEARQKHLEDLKQRKSFKDFAYTFVRKDGQERHWKISGTPFYSETGAFLGYRGVGRDVTEPVVLEEQLKQSQKMEVVGQLTGGIAHDFNNLLAVVLGNAELAAEMVEDEIDEERLLSHLKTIIHAASVGSSITSQLLIYSRKQTLQPKCLNLHHEISQFLEILKSSVGQMVMVHLTADNGLWETYLDRDQLVNTILNLSVNARDAMNRSGDLYIQLRNVVLEQEDPGLEISRGDYVCVKIRDTGAGMDEATLAHVFEPFYSTKEVGSGTGLGLSMVYGFVKKSDGAIRIESSLGQGTTVTLYFPKYTDETDS